VPERIRSASLVVAGRRLPLSRRIGAVRVTVPALTCHEVVVFAY